jgi:membrane protease subunit HflK
MSNDKFKNPWGDDGRKPPETDLDDLFKKGQEKFNQFFGTGSWQPGTTPPVRLLSLIGLVILGLWLSTGFYTVQPDEQGIVMRFGEYSRTTMPGLNYKLPAPIEKIIKVSVTRVNQEEIGFRSTSNRRGGAGGKNVPKESQMLTGDENIVDIDLNVQWVITDAKDYLFNVLDMPGENTVKNTAESAVREVIGRTDISSALAEERYRIEQEAKVLLQSILDSYKAGVQIVRLQMLRVEPPPEVLDAYRDVQTAKADKERAINQAYAYKNEVLPRARGEAEKLIQEAEGYRRRVIAEAEGEAQRFNSVYNEYRKAKDVTKKRMYLETLESILEGMDKIIIDKKASGGVIPFLPLNDFAKGSKADKSSKGASSYLAETVAEPKENR